MQRAHYERRKIAKDGSKLSVGIVVSDFNADITSGLLVGALDILDEWKVKENNIRVIRVPGAFELPLGCRKLLTTKKKPDAVIALGCVIKGETKHDEYISNSVAHALQDLMLSTGVPIGFGVITPNTLAQAKARSQGNANKGREASIAALEMALAQ